MVWRYGSFVRFVPAIPTARMTITPIGGEIFIMNTFAMSEGRRTITRRRYALAQSAPGLLLPVWPVTIPIVSGVVQVSILRQLHGDTSPVCLSISAIAFPSSSE
jgi:hypothetical protein